MARRTAPLVSLTLSAALVAAASTPRAADGAEVANATEPASRVVVEARFSPYRPRIGAAEGGHAPFRETFGGEKRLMLGGELDLRLLHVPRFGSIGIGGLFGWVHGGARVATAGEKAASGDVAFDLWLVSALAVVRVDVLRRETTVPLVPYAKVGPVTGLLSVSGDRDAVFAAGLARGHVRSSGMLYAAGVMLLLDVLDRNAARTLAVEHGLRHSYVFAEYTAVSIPGRPGTATPLGDTTWTLGLALEL